MSERRDGLPQNFMQAMAWYREAGGPEEANAYVNLGHIYCNGWAVPQDFVQSYKWFTLAADPNDDAGKYLDLVAAKMTPDQIAEAQELARKWQPKR